MSAALLHSCISACMPHALVMMQDTPRPHRLPPGVRCALPGPAEAEMGAGADALRQTAAELYAAAVQDVELLADGETAVVALRDTCRLRLFGISATRERGQVNLNPLGDEHIGFVVTQLALSPDGRMLAVSTDGPRILVLRVAGPPAQQQRRHSGSAARRALSQCCHLSGVSSHCWCSAGMSTHCEHGGPYGGPKILCWTGSLPFRTDGSPGAGWEQLRTIIGLTVEPFHQAAAAWHRSGFYIMAAAAAGQVFVFHVGSGKVRMCSTHTARCVCYLESVLFQQSYT